MVTKDEILAKASEVEDPEIGVNVVDLGLIYDISISDDGSVGIKMTLTTPYCPYGPALVSEVQRAAQSIEGVKHAEVEVVWNPPWNPSEMASDYAKDVLGLW
jgi:metal-sulfur cluster biosynthetic enzyme